MKIQVRYRSLFMLLMSAFGAAIFLRCAEALMIAAAIEEKNTRDKIQDQLTDFYSKATNATVGRAKLSELKIKSIRQLDENSAFGVQNEMFFEEFDTLGNQIYIRATAIILNKNRFYSFHNSFDDKGRMLRRIISDRKDGAATEKETFTYNDQGLLSESTRENMDGKVTWKNAKEYNEKNLLMRDISFDVSNNELLWEINNQYDQNDSLVSVVIKNPITGTITWQYQYNVGDSLNFRTCFNSLGQLQEQHTLTNHGILKKKLVQNDDGTHETTFYQYDAAGRMIETTSTKTKSQGGEVVTITTFMYDPQGRLIETTSANKNKKSGDPAIITMYKYDDKNREISMIQLEEKKSKKKEKARRLSYFYANDLKSYTELYKDGKMISKTIYEYAYYN